MAVIVIKNLEEKTIEVRDFSKSILQHVQGDGTDWMFACGGKGRCTTCKAVVVQGLENLEPKTAAESRYETLGLLGPSERLSCQARIRGSVTICVPEEYKLPHIKYSD